MALVTLQFYDKTYIGEEIATADFPRFEARAEDLILGMIKHTPEQAEALHPDLLMAVRKAICAQIEFFNEYGVLVATYGRSENGFTVGKVRVDASGDAGAKGGARSMIAPAVYVYLERTGLLYNAVPTACEPWANPWYWF